MLCTMRRWWETVTNPYYSLHKSQPKFTLENLLLAEGLWGCGSENPSVANLKINFAHLSVFMYSYEVADSVYLLTKWYRGWQLDDVTRTFFDVHCHRHTTLHRLKATPQNSWGS